MNRMLPSKVHLISVVAVYWDGVEMKQNTNFTHNGMYTCSVLAHKGNCLEFTVARKTMNKYQT